MPFYMLINPESLLTLLASHFLQPTFHWTVSLRCPTNMSNSALDFPPKMYPILENPSLLMVNPIYSLHSCSVVSDFVIPWTVVHQVPLPIGFSRQKYWIELPFPPAGDLSDPGVKTMSPALQVDSLLLSHQRSPFTHH